MNSKYINIAKDFSVVPAGRFNEDGPFNGTTFRQRFLLPAFRHYQVVQVDLEGTEGFGSSFLEEAFGGLVREEGLTSQEILDKLTLLPKSGSGRIERYKRLIARYIMEARPNG